MCTCGHDQEQHEDEAGACTAWHDDAPCRCGAFEFDGDPDFDPTPYRCFDPDVYDDY